MSSYFEPSNAEKVSKMFADITQEELDLMVEFGLDNGDGLVDREEFIILMVVRIGHATPELIVRLTDRFRELNRKNEMDQIHYDDIVAGRRKVTAEMRKRMFANTGLHSLTLSSFADSFHQKIHPSGNPLSSRSSRSNSAEQEQVLSSGEDSSRSLMWSEMVRRKRNSSSADQYNQQPSTDSQERGDSKTSIWSQRLRQRLGSASSEHEQHMQQQTYTDFRSGEDSDSSKLSQKGRMSVSSSSSDQHELQGEQSFTLAREDSESMSWSEKIRQRFRSGSLEYDNHDPLVTRPQRIRQRSTSSEKPLHVLPERMDSTLSADTTTFSPLKEVNSVRRFSFGGTALETAESPQAVRQISPHTDVIAETFTPILPDPVRRFSCDEVDITDEAAEGVHGCAVSYWDDDRSARPQEEAVAETLSAVNDSSYSLSATEELDQDEAAEGLSEEALPSMSAVDMQSIADDEKQNSDDDVPSIEPTLSEKDEYDDDFPSIEHASRRERKPSLKKQSSDAIPVRLLMQNLRAQSSKNLLASNSSQNLRTLSSGVVFSVRIEDTLEDDDNVPACEMPRLSGRRRSSVHSGGRRSSVHITWMGHELLEIQNRKWIRIYQTISHPHMCILIACLVWLTTGTIFYHVCNRKYGSSSLVHAFFTSISAGYAMFWITVENTPGVKVYTICHIFFGVVALGSVRAAVAHSLAESKMNWYICRSCMSCCRATVVRFSL